MQKNLNIQYCITYVYVCILDIYPTQIVGLEMISEWKRSTLCVVFFLSI
jgi:hypothetical protein